MNQQRTPVSTAPSLGGGDKQFIVTATVTVAFDSRDGLVRNTADARDAMLEVLCGLSTREFTISTQVVLL